MSLLEKTHFLCHKTRTMANMISLLFEWCCFGAKWDGTEKTRSGRIWTRATAKHRARVGSVGGKRSAQWKTASSSLHSSFCEDSLHHPTALTFTRKDAQKHHWVDNSPRLLCAGTTEQTHTVSLYAAQRARGKGNLREKAVPSSALRCEMSFCFNHP